MDCLAFDVQHARPAYDCTEKQMAADVDRGTKSYSEAWPYGTQYLTQERVSAELEAREASNGRYSALRLNPPASNIHLLGSVLVLAAYVY